MYFYDEGQLQYNYGWKDDCTIKKRYIRKQCASFWNQIILGVEKLPPSPHSTICRWNEKIVEYNEQSISVGFPNKLKAK